MALITKKELYSYAERQEKAYRLDARSILSKENKSDIANFSESSQQQKYDIFLCHSMKDEKVILGLKKYFTALGFITYVDWDDDPQLNRSKVDKKTAHLLRTRMQNSNCLVYASSDNSPTSKWMPWECGYFDGLKNSKVAICPISELASQSSSDQYNGLEYLSLYPYLANGVNQASNKNILWIHESPTKYVAFEEWLQGAKPRLHLR